MTTPLNILLFGKIPAHIKTVSETVQPEAQVIQVASTVEDAIAALQSYISGSNDKKLDIIVMGGGFTPADYEQVVSVEGAKSVPWFRPDPKTLAAVAKGEKPPTGEEVAQRLKSAIGEHVEELREGRAKGELWYF